MYNDKIKEYVEQARKDGKRIKIKYANGLDYLYVFERDGWISIINVTGGYYSPVIQAKDEAHADSCIGLIEAVTIPINIIA